jgi:hypothetical protein
MSSAVVHIKVCETDNFISIFRITWAAFNFQYEKSFFFFYFVHNTEVVQRHYDNKICIFNDILQQTYLISSEDSSS